MVDINIDTENKTVVKRTTKAEFIKIVEKQRELLEQLGFDDFNPEKEEHAQKVQASFDMIGNLIGGDSDKLRDELSEQLIKSLSSITRKVADEIVKKNEELSSFNTAIEEQSSKLEELYGIEEAAGTLLTLMNAAKEFEAKHKADKAEKIASTRQEYEGEKARLERELEEFKIKIDREQEEYEYNKKIKQRDDRDAFKNELKIQREEFETLLAQRRKEFEHEKEEFEKVKMEQDEYLERINELEQRIEDIPDELKEKFEKEKAIATNAVKSNYENKLAVTKAESDAEVRVLNEKTVLLSSRIKNLEEELAKSTDKLDNAYEQMRKLSEATVSSKQSEDMMTQFQSFAEKISQGKK